MLLAPIGNDRRVFCELLKTKRITLTIVVSAHWCPVVFYFPRVAGLVSKKPSKHGRVLRSAKKLLIFAERVPIGFAQDLGSLGSKRRKVRVPKTLDTLLNRVGYQSSNRVNNVLRSLRKSDLDLFYSEDKSKPLRNSS